jgi:hypothetical protein
MFTVCSLGTCSDLSAQAWAWTSSNEAVVTVDSVGGFAVGRMPGTAERRFHGRRCGLAGGVVVARRSGIAIVTAVNAASTSKQGTATVTVR